MTAKLRPDPTSQHKSQPAQFVALCVSVPPDTHAALRVAARLRDSSVDRLLLDLLAIVASEPQLLRAIFDDDF